MFNWFWNLFKPAKKDYEIIILEETKPTPAKKKAVARKRVPAKGIVAKKKAVKKVKK